MFSLIVFDLDGTLVDSRRDLAESVNLMLESYGSPALPEDAVGRMVGNGAPTLVARAVAAAGLDRPPDALDRFLKIYDTRLLKHTRPYPRIPEVLETLGGRASLAVLTNKPLAAARSILAGLDLARYFDEDAVLGGDGPFPRKPEPTGLRHLIARAGVESSSTLMVGDSIIDWRTAQSGSTAMCLVRYGFGFEGVPFDELGPSDHTIATPIELLDLASCELE